MVLEVITPDAVATQAWGEALGAALIAGLDTSLDAGPPGAQPGALVIALHGDLGAGKTTFVQGLARGLGVRARVTSPTFVLINEYPAGHGLRLVHLDTYRLGGPAGGTAHGAAADETTQDEAEALGLLDLLDDPAAVVAIEWAERIAPLLPADHLLLEFHYGPAPDTRRLRLVAFGPRSAAAVEKVRG